MAATGIYIGWCWQGHAPCRRRRCAPAKVFNAGFQQRRVIPSPKSKSVPAGRYELVARSRNAANAWSRAGRDGLGGRRWGGLALGGGHLLLVMLPDERVGRPGARVQRVGLGSRLGAPLASLSSLASLRLLVEEVEQRGKRAIRDELDRMSCGRASHDARAVCCCWLLVGEIAGVSETAATQASTSSTTQASTMSSSVAAAYSLGFLVQPSHRILVTKSIPPWAACSPADPRPTRLGRSHSIIT